MFVVIRMLMIVSFLVASPKTLAADICASTPEGRAAALKLIAEVTPHEHSIIPGVSDELMEQLKRNAPSWWFSQFANPAPPPVENRFSWWGYRHKELHDHGVVAELLKKSYPTNCCNGTDGGECRVTKYVTDGVGKRKVLIDGLVCDLSDDTKIVQLDTFNEPDTIVVCAGKSEPIKGAHRSCPKSYCIGGGRLGT